MEVVVVVFLRCAIHDVVVDVRVGTRSVVDEFDGVGTLTRKTPRSISPALLNMFSICSWKWAGEFFAPMGAVTNS